MSAILEAFEHDNFGGNQLTLEVGEDARYARADFENLGRLGNDKITSYRLRATDSSHLYQAFFFEHAGFQGQYWSSQVTASRPVEVTNVGVNRNDRVSSILLVRHAEGKALINVASLLANPNVNPFEGLPDEFKRMLRGAPHASWEPGFDDQVMLVDIRQRAHITASDALNVWPLNDQSYDFEISVKVFLYLDPTPRLRSYVTHTGISWIQDGDFDQQVRNVLNHKLRTNADVISSQLAQFGTAFVARGQKDIYLLPGDATVSGILTGNATNDVTVALVNTE